MTTPIITATNIGKKYNITHTRGGYIALRDVLMNVFKNPFSFLKGKAKEIIGRDTKEEFWALRGVNFEIQRGEVIGIIGRNGAGKSTLLKILSQITPPTTGEIKMHGTVGSLLEVGTGFHPELTGRENIFLNGAILGMKKKEIAKKFDEIVSFAGIEKFLDTPVKYYSSGMYVRLAFSVAAHMEPDILIIDEVLAVGDAEFQKKCLNKMKNITKDQGRTILFVSHNMGAIKNLCPRSILLEKGELVSIGNTSDILDLYLNSKTKQNPDENITTGSILKNIKVTNQKEESVVTSGDTLNIRLKYETSYNTKIDGARVVFTVVNTTTQQVVLMLDSFVSSDTWEGGIEPQGEILCTTDSVGLTEGEYSIHADFIIQGTSIEYIPNMIDFRIVSDLPTYHYKNSPDTNTCNRMIRHQFTAN